MKDSQLDPEEKQFDDDFFASDSEKNRLEIFTNGDDFSSTSKINESDNEEKKLSPVNSHRSKSSSRLQSSNSRRSNSSSMEKTSLQENQQEFSDREDDVKSSRNFQDIHNERSNTNSRSERSPVVASRRVSNNDFQENRNNSSKHSDYETYDENNNGGSRLSNESRHSKRLSPDFSHLSNESRHSKRLSPDFSHLSNESRHSKRNSPDYSSDSSDDQKVTAKTVAKGDNFNNIANKQYDDTYSENETVYSRPSSLKSSNHSEEESEEESSLNKDGELVNSLSSPEKKPETKERKKKIQPNQNIVRANGPPPKGRIAFVSSGSRYKPGGATRGRGRGNVSNGKNPQLEKKSVVVNRVISANRNKTQNLHNIIAQLQQEIKDLTSENRYLQRSAKLQDREIRKLDNAEAELPSLLKKHSNELNSLQERYRRMKEKAEQFRNSSKKQEEILLKTQETLKKYEAMVKDKKLEERATLQEKIKNMEKELEDKEKKISELTRTVGINKKIHVRELKEATEKNKKLLDDLHRAENDQVELLRKLKDKEKLLEITNIYSLRVNRRGSKEEERVGIFSPSEPVPPAIKRYQEEQERQHEESARIAYLSETARESNASTKEAPQWRTAKSKKAKSINIPKEEFGSDKSDNEEGNNLQYDLKKSEIKKHEDSDKKAEEQKQRTERELEQRMVEKARLRKEKEDERKREENLRLEEERIQEAAKRLILDDLESKKMKENEKERKIREEEAKLDEENKYILQKFKEDEDMEKQRKKELLLARMKAIDMGVHPDNSKEDSKVDLLVKPPESKRREKPIFLQSPPLSPKQTKNNFDSINKNSIPVDKQSVEVHNEKSQSYHKAEKRLSWDFKKTDENLHKGLPAHFDSENSPINKRRNVTENTENNSRTLPVRGPRSDNDLFSNESDQRVNDTRRPQINNGMREDSLEEFPKNNTSKKNNTVSPFDMFEDPFKAKKKNEVLKKQKNSVVNSDEDLNGFSSYQPSISSKPRQQRQHINKLNSASSDNFIDDLEEMILI